MFISPNPDQLSGFALRADYVGANPAQGGLQRQAEISPQDSSVHEISGLAVEKDPDNRSPTTNHK